MVRAMLRQTGKIMTNSSLITNQLSITMAGLIINYIFSSDQPALIFVCVEVLWPSQPNGVMSSAVSLPNHTFTGQA